MPTIGEQQKICGYRRGDMPDGVCHVAHEYAMHLVLTNNIDEILKTHEGGAVSVTPVLDYSAKRGKHHLTQAMINAGITVTRDAIRAAAKLGGVGVDLLLAGLKGESLEMARHDALHARLVVGEFRRAQELLDLGVKPSAECYNALEVGAKLNDREGWRLLCQPLLDEMLPLTDIEQLTDETLSVILHAGRPIHIERTLEIAKRPPGFLLVPALICNATEAVETLQGMGVKVDEETFIACAADLATRRLADRLRADERLLNEFEKTNGATMSARGASAFLPTRMKDWEFSIAQITQPDERAYKIGREILLPLLNCMDPNEQLKLFDVIDGWRKQYAYPPVSMHATTVLKHVIALANQERLAQQFEAESPQP